MTKETTNDYATLVQTHARKRADAIENEYTKQNFAWANCNSTFYLKNKANKDLADTRAKLNSAIAEQEDDNANGIKVDGISTDAMERQVGYKLDTCMEYNFQHNADLIIYKEVSGKDWTAPVKGQSTASLIKSIHFDTSKAKELADQYLASCINI